MCDLLDLWVKLIKSLSIYHFIIIQFIAVHCSKVLGEINRSATFNILKIWTSVMWRPECGYTSEDTGRHLRFYRVKQWDCRKSRKKYPVLQELCVQQLAPLAESWKSVRAAGQLDSSTQTAALSLERRSEINRRQSLSSWNPALLYGLIWLLTLPVLPAGGQGEDRTGRWHRGGRGWRWGRGGGGGGHCLSSAFSSSYSRWAVTGFPYAAGGGGWRPPSWIFFGLLSHQVPLPPTPLPPHVSVPCGWGSNGWRRLVLLGLPACISEAGQRGAEPHPTAGRALYGFLKLLGERVWNLCRGKVACKWQHTISKVNIWGDELSGRLVE